MPPQLQADLQQVVAAASSGRTAEARSLCEWLIRQHGSFAHLHFILGALSSGEGDHAAAEGHYRRAADLDASHAAARCNLGLTLTRRGAAAEAVRFLREAISLQPDLAEAHLNLAGALRSAGDPEAALLAAREAVRLAPAHVAALVLLGELLLSRRGEDADGVVLEIAGRSVDAARAAQVAPEHAAAAHALLGSALEAKGEFEPALAAFREAERHCADSRAAELRMRLTTRALRERLAPREGDVFIATFPKSGTTWVQLIACMLSGEPPTVDVHTRAPWIEAAFSI